MIISLIIPPAVLLATLMAYGSLSKFSEITAMKANGISLYRITFPALIFAAFMALVLFYFTELITPASIQKTEHIEKIDIQKQQTLGYFKQNELWYRGNDAIYNFKMFDVSNDTLRGITIN
jgi:lipopolysaccharide export system permease protein